MRLRAVTMLATMVSVALFVAAVDAAQKGQKKTQKKAEGEKVEMSAVPAPVLATAKKEAPNVNFTAAEKRDAGKKQGTVYTLEGKEGKYEISLVVGTDGELQRLVKSLERKRKKNQ